MKGVQNVYFVCFGVKGTSIVVRKTLCTSPTVTVVAVLYIVSAWGLQDY